MTIMKQRFFGHPESPLFGVYHKPRKSKVRTAPRAAVICPPVGQEYNRTHWALRLLANQLSRKNIHVLRFDYHGIGDSSQKLDQVDRLEIWQQNIVQAVDHLKQESHAETVMLIGQRMGGSLAAMVAEERADVNSLVLWEPVVAGRMYLDHLRAMHAQMLDLWVCKMSTENNESHEEILGSRYCRQLLNAIEGFRLDVNDIIQPQLIVDQPGRREKYTHSEPSLLKFVPSLRSSSWYQLNELETAYLRPEITREIVKLVDEMFQRLDHFDALRITPLHASSEEVQ